MEQRQTDRPPKEWGRLIKINNEDLNKEKLQQKREYNKYIQTQYKNKDVDKFKKYHINYYDNNKIRILENHKNKKKNNPSKSKNVKEKSGRKISDEILNLPFFDPELHKHYRKRVEGLTEEQREYKKKMANYNNNKYKKVDKEKEEIRKYKKIIKRLSKSDNIDDIKNHLINIDGLL